MTITVKFFASLREKFEDASITVEQHDRMTVEDIWKQISGDDVMPVNVLSAINLDFAQTNDIVKDGDEVAFFPPVTGG